jgi:hypothetical protein
MPMAIGCSWAAIGSLPLKPGALKKQIPISALFQRIPGLLAKALGLPLSANLQANCFVNTEDKGEAHLV